MDPEDGSYYVSNINGGPLEKDGNGYISKINPNGSIVIQKFIGGKEAVLNAPKGLVLSGKTLFVTDIDVVKGFNKENGKLTVTVDFSSFSAKFLNDLTADSQGVLYTSDMLTNRIFKINPAKNYEISVYSNSPELGGPNGVLFNPKTKNLMVVTWTKGEILEIERSTGKVHVLKKGLNGLDGIDYDASGNLYVSSFQKGEIYRIPLYGRGTITTYLGGLRTPADISYDRKRDELLIPSFEGNTVTTVRRK